MAFQRIVLVFLALSLGCDQGQPPQPAAGNAKDAKLPAAKGDGSDQGQQPQPAAGNAKDAKLPAAKGDGGDRTQEAKAVVKKVLDAWVFGDGSYDAEKGGKDHVRFRNVDYALGYPLAGYEIGAARQVGFPQVMVTLKFPTRGGIAEIKKNLIFVVMWEDEAGNVSAAGTMALVTTTDPEILRAAREEMEKQGK